MRTHKRERQTAETQIELDINLDGTGKNEISTGIPFFDHMLVLFSRHGLFDLTVKATGDLSVDYHHTVEDVGIVLGEAIKSALGGKLGIRRYGFFILPMDECLTRVAIDLSNRPYLHYDVSAEQLFVRDFNIQLVKEFYQALASALGANIHITLLHGDEPHHIAESIFKCFARSLDMATGIDPRIEGMLPSSKELLT